MCRPSPAASLVQSARDCCPAPIPTHHPGRAYVTVFDWVWRAATIASIRSETAESRERRTLSSPIARSPQ